MSDIRQVDLDARPNSDSEVRLRKGDVVVSVWLPVAFSAFGGALMGLAEAGFDFDDRWRETERKPSAAEGSGRG